jgi:Flp pilus assembly protein TadG
MRSVADSRRGITLPIIAVFLTAFLGLAAFAVDLARWYLMRAQLQTAAEAGALAGVTRLLNDDATHAADSALGYVQVNAVDGVVPDLGPTGITPGRWNGTFQPTSGWSDPATDAVRVETQHEGAYVFGRVYGATTRTLRASAVASIAWVTRTRCIRPLAIPYASLLRTLYPTDTPDVTYDLTVADIARLRAMSRADAIPLKLGSSESDATPPGFFYPVRLPPARFANGEAGNPQGGGDNYRTALAATCTGAEGSVGIGDWLAGESGNMAGPTRSGVSQACGANGGANFVCDPAVPYLLPIWDIADKSVAAPRAFRVKYIGVFFVTSYDNQKGILGYFNGLTVHGQVDTIPSPLRSAILRR